MNVTVTGDGAGPGTDTRVADFAAWVTPHLAAMARLAARLVPSADRDDVVQEALVRAWRRRSTFDPARGTAGTWLLAIVADCARRSRVRGRRTPSAAGEPGPAGWPAEPGAAAWPAAPGAGARDDLDRDIDVERALRRLPRRERLAVALYYFVGLDVAATAQVMSCSPGTVKATLHHARAHLRDLLGGDQGGQR